MASTFTTSLRLEKQATGENLATWGSKANNVFEMIEDAIAGYISIPIANVDTELTAVPGTVDQSRNFMLNFTGTFTADRTITIPEVSKTYIVKNSTVGGFSVILKVKNTANTYTLRTGQSRYVYTDGVTITGSEAWITPSSAAQRWGIEAFIDTNGVIEAGKTIDFHNTNTNATDFSVRLGTTDATAVVSTSDLFITPTGGTARKVWNDGNDGALSGLDADKLDGFHAADLGFPTGTKMLFIQTAAPTGWTKDTTYNDRMLRIVSGTAGAGGLLGVSTVFTAARSVTGTVGGTAITVAQMPAHNHPASSGTESTTHYHTFSDTTSTTSSAGAHTHTVQGSGGPSTGGGLLGTSYSSPFSSETTSSAGAHTHTVSVSGNTSADIGSHTHTITVSNNGSDQTHTHPWSGSVDISVAYCDAIICTKN